jgi:hypothetical protein
MDRTSADGTVLDTNGHRIRVAVNLASGIQGTEVDPLYDNELQEEIVGGIIEFLGLTPDATNFRQVQQALLRLTGAHVTVVAANAVLTADEAGLIKVNATAGNIAITLPAAASANNVPLQFSFVRLDATGNTVTISCAGEDVIYPGDEESFALLASTPVDLKSDGAALWRDLSAGASGIYLPLGGGTMSGALGVLNAAAANQPAAFGQVLGGFGATLRNPSRAFGTVYTNSTGRPIWVVVYSASGSSGSGQLYGYLNGSIVAQQSSTTYASTAEAISLIVPPGATYEFTGVNMTLTQWTEL